MQGVDPRKGKAVKPFRLAVGAMQMQMQETWLKQVWLLRGFPRWQATRGIEMRVSEVVRRDVVRRGGRPMTRRGGGGC